MSELLLNSVNAIHYKQTPNGFKRTNQHEMVQENDDDRPSKDWWGGLTIEKPCKKHRQQQIRLLNVWGHVRCPPGTNSLFKAWNWINLWWGLICVQCTLPSRAYHQTSCCILYWQNIAIKHHQTCHNRVGESGLHCAKKAVWADFGSAIDSRALQPL